MGIFSRIGEFGGIMFFIWATYQIVCAVTESKKINKKEQEAKGKKKRATIEKKKRRKRTMFNGPIAPKESILAKGTTEHRIDVDAPDRASPIVKRSEKIASKYSLSREYTTSEDDVRVMRVHIRGWISAGKLEQDQIMIFETTAGRYASGLTATEREQLLALFNVIRRKLGVWK